VRLQSSISESRTAARLLPERRLAVEEASQLVPLDRLAISPQCGFASGEIARTMTLAQQEAKLRLIGDVARRIWA
jgi:methionine synthase II (cobalamin-independent)